MNSRRSVCSWITHGAWVYLEYGTERSCDCNGKLTEKIKNAANCLWMRYWVAQCISLSSKNAFAYFTIIADENETFNDQGPC